MAGTENRVGIPQSREEAHDLGLRMARALQVTTSDYERHKELSSKDHETLNGLRRKQGTILSDMLLLSEDYQNPLDLFMDVSLGLGEVLHDFSRPPVTLKNIPFPDGAGHLSFPLHRIRKKNALEGQILTSREALRIASNGLGNNLCIEESPVFTQEFKMRTIDEVQALIHAKKEVENQQMNAYVNYVVHMLCRDRLQPMGAIPLEHPYDATYLQSSDGEEVMRVSRSNMRYNIPLKDAITPAASPSGHFILPEPFRQY